MYNRVSYDKTSIRPNLAYYMLLTLMEQNLLRHRLNISMKNTSICKLLLHRLNMFHVKHSLHKFEGFS